MTVSIIVPFGGQACEWRTRARDWIHARYRELHPDWELIEGTAGEPWSKGAACADAVGRSSGDVIVIADADTFIDAHHLADTVERVEHGVAWAVPHDKVWRLNADATEHVYRGGAPRKKLDSLARPAYRGVFGGGIVVVTRDAWQKVGGIDPRFYGWGGEDLTFGWALHALAGVPWRGTCDLWHLWHPHALGDQADTLRGSEASEALVAEYKALRRNPEGMRALIARR